MVDIVTKLKRSEIMSRTKSSGTKLELQVRAILDDLGYEYQVNCMDLPGTPDIVVDEAGTVVFVHACYYHRHQAKSCRMTADPDYANSNTDWAHKFKMNQARDRRVATKCRKLGWSVLTVWGCRLANKAGRERVARRLERYLRTRGGK